jgi:DNA-binding NtrC family response regulator
MAKLTHLPTLKERNDRYIRRVFKLCGGNVSQTARVLGIGRATAYRELQRLGVDFAARERKRLADIQLRDRLDYLGRPARTL